MARLSRTAVVTTALVIGAVGGCAWTDARASARLRAELPEMISSAGFDTMPDWRLIGYPPETIRSFFTYDGTYRVIDSDVDDATLAVWRTGPEGGEPLYNETIVATGSACVRLHRQPEAVKVEVVDCPVPLSDTAPWSDDFSWGQDAEAVRQASFAVVEATEAIREVMLQEPDGRPRTTDRTAHDIVTAAADDDPTDDITVIASDVQQTGRIVTLSLTATAVTPEAVDTTRTATATWCGHVQVDLDDRYPNLIGDDGPCV